MLKDKTLDEIKHLKNIWNNTSALLGYISATCNASSEEDVYPLLDVLRPSEDREAMGDVYKAAFGYNPLTYFDERAAYRMYQQIMKIAPTAIKERLRESEIEILDKVMDAKSTMDERYLYATLVLAIDSVIGWKSEDIDFSSIMIEEMYDDLPDVEEDLDDPEEDGDPEGDDDD